MPVERDPEEVETCIVRIWHTAAFTALEQASGSARAGIAAGFTASSRRWSRDGLTGAPAADPPAALTPGQSSGSVRRSAFGPGRLRRRPCSVRILIHTAKGGQAASRS